MRIAIIYYTPRLRDKAHNACSAIGSVLQGEGHQVVLYDIAQSSDSNLTSYDYIIILAEAVSNWSSRIAPALSRYLARSGVINGKRCTALLMNTVLWKTKTLLTLMKVLEKEGMVVNYSTLVLNDSQARRLALQLPITHA